MTFQTSRMLAMTIPPFVACALTIGCGGDNGSTSLPDATALENSCGSMLSAAGAAGFPVATTTIASSTFVPATSTLPGHCQIDGEIGRHTGIDGQSYAVKFRLRMPTAAWNGRFYMGGGGGTNGALVDPTNRLAQGYATIGTDGGHDNVANNVLTAGGTSSFGVDPQARADFAYNAYDEVTQVGKSLVATFYKQQPKYSYFVGCSEGGREAMLMSQRFPTYYDGIVAGDPVLHIPLGPLSGLYTTQLFAGLATRSGLTQPNGSPAIVNTFSDKDLMLIRGAVLNACDALDGLTDGIVDNLAACTSPLVSAQLASIQCAGSKTDACLTADQISTMKTAYAGAVNSEGTPLYSDWQWDAGMSAQNGSSYSQSWRSWWLGTYGSTTNNATKLSFASAEAVIYTTPPLLPISAADSLSYSLNYNFDTEPIKLYETYGPYTQSTAEMTFTDSPDLSKFQAHGGKMMMYQGGSDSSVSIKDTLRWYDAMNVRMGSNAQSFVRMFPVPGMNHCSGGPATDSFDMLPQVVNWVEKGVAPESVVASATNPGYFGVASRTRPLCAYPKHTHYNGTGDINDAANFTCQ